MKRLYKWSDPYPVYYGNSNVVVLAESEEEARELVAASFPPQFNKIAGPLTLDRNPEVSDSIIWIEWSE